MLDRLSKTVGALDLGGSIVEDETVPEQDAIGNRTGENDQASGYAISDLEADLGVALSHLFDPLYAPTDGLLACLAPGRTLTRAAFSQALRDAIERLHPDKDVPVGSPLWRSYRVLRLRYLERLTQEAAAEQMGMSARYLRDLQRRAIESLAALLWEDVSRHERVAERTTSLVEGTDVENASTIRPNEDEQLAQELLSLGGGMPSTCENVSEVIRGAVELSASLPWAAQADIAMAQMTEEMVVLAHPTVLRQIVLRSIEGIARGLGACEIKVSLVYRNGMARLLVSGSPGKEIAPRVHLIDRLARAYGGNARGIHGRTRYHIKVWLPAHRDRVRRKVAVIDDNADAIALYRAYLLGTNIDIVDLSDATGSLIEAVIACDPDAIVLDVMLPDPNLDGWELLMRLRQHPQTEHLPVVMCSVVADEELAAGLGASASVAKPVMRQGFLEAVAKALDTDV